MDNFQTNEKTLNDINIQLQQVSRVENYINSDDSSDPPAIHDINDVALSSLVEKLTDAQLERNKMLASIPEQNPAYAPLNKQIKSLKDLIKTNISQIKDGLQARKSQLQKASSAYESTIKNVPGQERELGGIKRQQSIKEELYIYLLQKREEIGLDYAATIPTASTIEAASYYQKPSKGPYITAIAFFLGLLIPAGMIYGRDFLNDKIVDKKDLEYNTNVPVISEIILDENSSPELILNKTRYILGEQFRDLRTKLNSLFPKERKGRVILLTSSIPSEGKSFLAANLGATLAVSNKKTIILELDLRLPKISKIINLNSDHAGIADYLNNQAKPEDIIQPSGIHPCMDIIGTGTLPDNPTELLGSEKMAELIKLLKSKYDYVLIDTPPIHLVTDAKIIAGFCDLTLYAVRQNITPKSEMEFINTTLVEQSLPHMYLIFNGVQEAGRFRYGYRLNYNYYLKSPKSGTSSFKDFFSRF